MKKLMNIEAIRVLNSLQNDALQQVAALRGLAYEVAGDDSFDEPDGKPGLYAELADAEKTARDHVQALQHCISRLSAHAQKQA